VTSLQSRIVEKRWIEKRWVGGTLKILKRGGFEKRWIEKEKMWFEGTLN